MKISRLRELFHRQLSSLYDEREIDAIFFIYIENNFDIKKHQFFLDPLQEIRDDGGAARDDLDALSKGTPIQYITEKTVFYGLPLSVDPSVLIPRPETEELVMKILQNKKEKRKSENSRTSSSTIEKVPEGRDNLYKTKILDLCTGSGAIAIALAKNIKNAEIWATDISEDALETAKGNAVNNDTEIIFLHHDVLNDDILNLPDQLDIIVSNPPYIPNSERKRLHKNVMDFEPDIALFVPDENPLVFYEAIAETAKKILHKGGSLYLETYEKFHSELYAMLTKKNFKEIELWNDLNGKPRFISCKKL